ICTLLLQRRSPFFGELNGISQGHLPGLIGQLSDTVQDFLFTPGRVVIQPDGFGELEQRNTIIVSSRNKRWLLIGQRNLRLQNVEARDGSRFEAILLVLQLLFKEMDGLLLYPDQRTVENNLVKLLAHRGNDAIDRVAECEDTGITREVGPADRGNDRAVVKQLGSGQRKIVGIVGHRDRTDRHHWCWTRQG